MNILKFNIEETNNGYDYLVKNFYMYSVIYTRDNYILPDSIPSVALFVNKNCGKLSKEAFFCRKNIKIDDFEKSVEKIRGKVNLFPMRYCVTDYKSTHLVPYMITSNDKAYIYIYTYNYDDNNEICDLAKEHKCK